jgi:branched-chain amino acid transport system permease protein
MEILLTSVFNGVVYGLILFMISSGLTLIYGMMGILNLAHASFFMLGAYIGYLLSSLGFFWPGMIVAPLLVGLLGVMVERYMLRRIHQSGYGQEMIFTFGLSFVIEELIKLFFGSYPVSYAIPQQLQFSAFRLFESEYPFYRLLMGGVAIGIFGIIALLLNRTRVGLLVRAAETEPVMATALGHAVAKVFSIVFGVGASIAGLAGAVAGAYYPTSPTMALNFGMVVFVVVVVGGLGSIQGSFWASLLIGVITSCVIGSDSSLASVAKWIGIDGVVPSAGGIWTMPLSSTAGSIPFVLMIVVIIFRPSGLAGIRK